MDDNQEKPDERPSEESQPAKQEQTGHREISEEELKQILNERKKWLVSEREEGKPADLSGVVLSGANLSGANLSGVGVYKADLSRVDLSRADLSGANLNKTDLR